MLEVHSHVHLLQLRHCDTTLQLPCILQGSIATLHARCPFSNVMMWSHPPSTVLGDISIPSFHQLLGDFHPAASNSLSQGRQAALVVGLHVRMASHQQLAHAQMAVAVQRHPTAAYVSGLLELLIDESLVD